MSTAALFTTVKTGKQPKCLPVDEWTKMYIHMVYIHMVQYYSAIKNEISEFPGVAVVENLSANAGDTGLIPGLGRLYTPLATEPVSHKHGSPHTHALQQGKPPC